MPEETVTAPAVEVPETEPAPEPERKEPPEQNLVGEAKRRQRAAEQEAKELRDRLDALEDKDRSEVEKAQKRAERAEERAQELETKTLTLERGAWLRSAAQAEGFHDPSDAVDAAKDLASIESEKDAKQFVKELAARKEHLLKPKEPTPDVQKLGRVLDAERSGNKPDPRQDAEIEQAKSFAAELKRLNEQNWQ